ncbi:hypothetical protein QBC46DRAFT_252167, partial [Diplogelasinospora grovesii]
LLKARYNLTGYVKAEVLFNTKLKNIASFFKHYIFYRYKLLLKVVINNGLKFKAEIKKLYESIRVYIIIILTYNLRANGLNKAGY